MMNIKVKEITDMVVDSLFDRRDMSVNDFVEVVVDFIYDDDEVRADWSIDEIYKEVIDRIFENMLAIRNELAVSA